MASSIKQRMVAELAGVFREMAHALLVDFTGVSAGKADDLRDMLEEHGARMFVVKNALAILALRQLDLPDVADLVSGPTAFVCGGDPVAVTKAVLDWSRKERVLGVRGAMLDGKALEPGGVQALAALPPLEVLHAQVVGAIGAPLFGFAGVLQGVLRSFVGVVKAVAEAKT